MNNYNIFYVYIHYKLDINEPFYVGKGYGGRCFCKDRSPHWKNIVNKHGYTIKIISKNLSEQEAHNLEKSLIKEIGRSDLDLGPLINLTDGGEGCYGHLHSEETKNKMRLFHKNRSNQYKKNISISKKGKKRKPFSAEHRKNMSIAQSKRIYSEQELTNRTIAAKNRKPKTLEHKRNISIANIGIKKNIIFCPYCNKSGGEPAMKRWHFNKCKNKS